MPAFHGGEGAPPAYPWPDGKRGAVIVSVDFDGPSPYLWAKGQDRPVVMGELEQRRFGPRQGIWRMLAMVDRLGIPCSFYVPGAIVASHGAAVRSIAAGGYELALHGYMHERVNDLSEEEIRSTITRSKEAFAVCGVEGPMGYRSPSWEITPSVWSVLQSEGVLYDSSLMGADHPYWLDGIVEVPVLWTLDDAIYYRYLPGTVSPPHDPRSLIEAWRWEIDSIVDAGGVAVLTIHPWLSGRAGRLRALEEMLSGFLGDQRIWWTTSAEVALHHRRHAAASDGAVLNPGEIR